MFMVFFASLILSFNSFLPEATLIQGRNSIEGRVLTSENRPLDNVRVFLLTDYYGQLAQTYTDGGGRFRFRGLPRGFYYVQVEPGGAGYARQSQRVEINSPDLARNGGADIYTVDFVLKPDKNSKKEVEVKSPETVLFYQDVPNPAKEAYKQGMQSLKKNDLAGAEVALVHAIELFPDYYDALELLGSEYVKHAQYDAALPLLAHASEVNKRSWEAFYGLGVALLESNKRTEGLDALRQAATLNSQSININMRLGLELAKEEKSLEEAATLLSKVTQLAGKRLPDAYLALASIYSRRKQYTEEAAALEGYLRAKPDSPQRENIKHKIDDLRQKAKAQAQR